MIEKEKVIEKLKEILDPELHISVWDLGLIYKLDIKDDIIYIDMTLTTPGCPLMTTLPLYVKQELVKLDGVKDADVKLVWEPKWTPDRLTEEAKKKLGIET